MRKRVLNFVYLMSLVYKKKPVQIIERARIQKNYLYYGSPIYSCSLLVATN